MSEPNDPYEGLTNEEIAELELLPIEFKSSPRITDINLDDWEDPIKDEHS